MDFGSAFNLFGLEVELLQGLITSIYENDPNFQTILITQPAARLELDVPRFDFRDDGNFRMGMHLTGQIFIDDVPGPLVFDSWAHLRPVLGMANDKPIGTIEYVEVEDVVPGQARDQVEAAFGPNGIIGTALGNLEFDVFEELAKSVHTIAFPTVPLTQLDYESFSFEFYLGRPASIRHPQYEIIRDGDDYDPNLIYGGTFLTAPALIATIALAGEDPVPPNTPSIVLASTGLALVSTKRQFDMKFALESATIVGNEMQGLTMDSFEASSTDYGFDVKGGGHRLGATVSFEGELIAQFRGGTGGQLIMRSTIDTDLDTSWWVDVLSVIALAIPGLGWWAGHVYIWEPSGNAPEQVESSLLDKFRAPIDKVANDLSNDFDIPDVETLAFLSDIWFFDGNMAISVTSMAGVQESSIGSVSTDIAYLAKDPSGEGRRSNRKRTVESVGTINLSNGKFFKPWQAAELMEKGILRLPGYHVVVSSLAKGGMYVRGNPDGDPTNNLLG